MLMRKAHHFINNNFRCFNSHRTFASIGQLTDRPQNLIEKIVQKYALDLPNPSYKVKSGDFVTIQPEHVMTHDNTAAVMTK